jgi:SAM-dependent methyltransferase
MISERLLAIVRCPDCGGRLVPAQAGSHGVPAEAGNYRCTGCGRTFHGTDYLDMRPLRMFEEQTKYLDEALHADARHERVSEPLLGSRIRNGMLRSFLAPKRGELVADLGCGSGRAILWNRDLGADVVGIDIAPFFSREARAQVDLMLGDLRTLPFADATFDKAWSLDVLEHLSPEALDGMLAEAARVLKPGGGLFVYTHVRKNARIAIGLRWINRFAQWLDRRGIVDLRQEHLRKSDHLNPLRDIPHLEQVADAAGFRIGRIRYYTPIVGGFVENILVRAAEKALAKRAHARKLPRRQLPTPKHGGTGLSGRTETTERERTGETEAAAHAAAVREARAAAKERIAARGPTYLALRVVSFVMKLDLLLFGHVRSGPFFALLVRK